MIDVLETPVKQHYQLWTPRAEWINSPAHKARMERIDELQQWSDAECNAAHGDWDTPETRPAERAEHREAVAEFYCNNFANYEPHVEYLQRRAVCKSFMADLWQYWMNEVPDATNDRFPEWMGHEDERELRYWGLRFPVQMMTGPHEADEVFYWINFIPQDPEKHRQQVVNFARQFLPWRSPLGRALASDDPRYSWARWAKDFWDHFEECHHLAPSRKIAGHLTTHKTHVAGLSPADRAGLLCRRILFRDPELEIDQVYTLAVQSHDGSWTDIPVNRLDAQLALFENPDDPTHAVRRLMELYA